MHFVHRNEKQRDTIAAVATPPGEGGVAIIRVSGPEALSLVSSVASPCLKKKESHKAVYGKILDASGLLDSVLFLPMLDGKSFTGEEVVEIHCHGGSLVTRKIMELLVKKGARVAGPGEFSYRAFLNGKIDLAQAEAIQDLICAKNDLALKASEQQLEGRLSRKVQAMQQSLIQLLAVLEAWVDFPEEGLEFMSENAMLEALRKLADEVKKLICTFHEGKKVKDGLKLCLVGAPNAGKSSLMNALLDKDRAIVTAIPGTTRDIIEDTFMLNGMHCYLLDTAGIRESEEVVEKQGIERSFKAIQNADLLIWVLDGSEFVSEESQRLSETLCPSKTLLVWNKSDLYTCAPRAFSAFKQVVISAKNKEGLSLLKKAVDEKIWEGKGPPDQGELFITQVRHKEALEESLEYLKRALVALEDNLSPEFIVCDAKGALRALGCIIGLDVTDEVLGEIFSKFCVGK